MEIKTKFNIHDGVYFIDYKKILYGRVVSIIFDEDGAESQIFVYRIKCCNGYTAYLTEKHLFCTKEDAEQKLEEIENENIMC